MMPVPIETGLLCEDDARRLAGVSESVEHAMRVRQVHRTETEMRVAVLDHIHWPTPAARYFQSIREQCIQVEQLARCGFDSRKNDTKRRRAVEAQAQARVFGDDIGVDEQQIAIDECNFADRILEREAAERVREIVLWEKLKDEQIAADQTFDREDCDAHQLVSYTKRFILRAQISDASKMSGGELDNLLGQLRAGVSRAVEKGVIKQVLDGLPDAAVKMTEKQIKHFVPDRRQLQ